MRGQVNNIHFEFKVDRLLVIVKNTVPSVKELKKIFKKIKKIFTKDI